MGIKREFRCLAHGNFESEDEEPLCEHGCDTVERIFLTPVGLGSARTANIDRTFASLAKSHNLTDIGPGAMRKKALKAEQEQARYRDFCERRYGGIGWGAVPEGGTLNVGTKKIEGAGAGAIGAVQSAGASGSVSMDDSKPMFEAFKKPVLVRHDHENLKVDISKAA